eukprot:130731_1
MLGNGKTKTNEEKESNTFYLTTANPSMQNENQDKINVTKLNKQKESNAIHLSLADSKGKKNSSISLISQKEFHFDSNIKKEIVKHSKTHKTAIIIKLITTIFACLSGISIYFMTQDITPFHIIGFLFALVVCHFYILLVYLLYKAQNLHRVIISSKYHSGMGKIVYPHKMTDYPNECIVSFGEFLSNRGSSIFNLFMLTAIMLMSFCICVFAIRWTDRNVHKNHISNDKNKYFEQASNLFFLFGAIGYGIVAIWEAHYNDKCHKMLHYIGSISIVLSPLALCFKNWFSIFSLSLFALEWIFFILWFIVVTRT